MTAPVVGYAGMTHLGLNSAVAAAEKGFETICFDADSAHIAALNEGRLPVVEPDLPELLARNRARLAFSDNPGDLGRCDLVYVAPDVATDDGGESDLGPIAALIETIAPALGPQAALIVLSQVPPGFTRGLAQPATRRFYQVETLIFGRAMARALHPERFILGCADPAAPLPPALARFLAAFDCPVLPMRYESAELCKIAINACLVASVSTANTLAGLCERIGADWSEIVPALRLDRRIGQYAYLKPGLGIAGGNLERDLATIIRLADALGAETGVVRAWVANSRHRRDWVLRRLHEAGALAAADARLAVLGLAYKEDTASVKNSPALALLAALPRGMAVRVHDPVVGADCVPHPGVAAAFAPLDACAGADALAIMTPWPAYRDIAPDAVARAMRGRLVVDPLDVLDGAACRAAGLTRLTLGCPESEMPGGGG